MLPILAAINAVNTAEKLATGAMALWKQVTASEADAKIEASGPFGSFTDALASQGVTTTTSKSGNSTESAGAGGAQPALMSRLLNQLA